MQPFDMLPPWRLQYFGPSRRVSQWSVQVDLGHIARGCQVSEMPTYRSSEEKRASIGILWCFHSW